MRYPASEKLEIIRLVEESALPVRRTLEKVGIPRATFYRWYDLYQAGGPEALDDRHPKPDRVWNRIPDDVRERIIKLALEESALYRPAGARGEQRSRSFAGRRRLRRRDVGEHVDRSLGRRTGRRAETREGRLHVTRTERATLSARGGLVNQQRGAGPEDLSIAFQKPARRRRPRGPRISSHAA